MDKRIYPRINASFPIKITPDIIGEAVDVSETGLSCVFEKPLLLSRATAKIELSPKESIDTEFNVIWNKQLLEKNGFKYGACFIRLKEKDLSMLREILIKSYIKDIVAKINDNSKREKLLDFWLKDFKKYISGLELLSKKIKNDELLLSEASRISSELHDGIIKKADGLDLLINNKVVTKKLRDSFRTLCGPWVFQGKIVKRAFEKPRGYPGDHVTLETIYNNKPLSDGIGYCCDKYFLDDKYAYAVRKRKDFMRDRLVRFATSKDSPNNLSILNIASGSAREIREALSKTKKITKKINFSLADQDEEALSFSREMLGAISKNNIKYKFIRHNILEYIKSPQKYCDILGKYDLVYSIGLADYLPDRILIKLMTFCYSLLKPKGKFIIAHKDIRAYKPLPANWWCNWIFYPRDEEQLLSMVAKSDINKFDITIEREISQIIFFLTVTKQ